MYKDKRRKFDQDYSRYDQVGYLDDIMGVPEAPGTTKMRSVNHVQCAESPMLSSDVVVVYVQVTRINWRLPV
jgi:hypothetical protein